MLVCMFLCGETPIASMLEQKIMRGRPFKAVLNHMLKRCVNRWRTTCNGFRMLNIRYDVNFFSFRWMDDDWQNVHNAKWVKRHTIDKTFNGHLRRVNTRMRHSFGKISIETFRMHTANHCSRNKNCWETGEIYWHTFGRWMTHSTDSTY